MFRAHKYEKFDIEKNLTEVERLAEDKGDYKKNKSNTKVDLLAILIIFLLFGTTINILFINNLNMSQDDHLLNSFRRLFFDHDEPQGSSNQNLLTLLNFDNIDTAESEEWEKFSHDMTRQQIVHDNTPDQEIVIQSANAQRDLAEILSVNPIILLTNNENIIQQQQVKTMMQSLKISPEIKLINLTKHPHYDHILEYLKNYSLHNTDDIEDLNDIPRLFIGGSPVANYNDIINKFNTNLLIPFLNNVGKGLLKVEID